MKKIILLFAVILVSISLFAQDIHGVSTYKIKLREDDYFFNAKLFFNGQLSYFVWKQRNKPLWKVRKTTIKDGIVYDIEQIVYTDTIGYIVLKDLTKPYLEIRDFCKPNQPNVYNDSVKFNWKLGKETKIVQGLNCMKATCRFRGRDYVAWFSPEIAVPYGPWKFGGLPGLLVEIKDTRQEVLIQLKNLDLTQKPQFNIHLKGKKTNMKKLMECQDKEWQERTIKLKAKLAKAQALFPDVDVTTNFPDKRPSTELEFEK